MFFDFADNDEQDILKAVRTLAISDASLLICLCRSMISRCRLSPSCR